MSALSIPRRIRVLHLIKGLGRGGAERLLVDGLRHADRDHFEYAFGYFLPHKDQLATELAALGAEVTCFGGRTSAGVLLRTPAVRRRIEGWRPDLVHCHLPVSAVAARLAARRSGTPLVYTEHNLMERYHPWTRRANLATWRLQRRVVAVSAGVEASIRRLAPRGVPVEVVENGVDVERFRPDAAAAQEARRQLGVPPEAPLVGQVAVFRPQKRLDLWLACAAEIRRRRPEVRFVLVGDGPERARLERIAGGPELAGAVVFAGLQEDVRAYYAALDVYLVSSDYEGLPVALLEAMASGAPVVSTSVGGVPEVVREGRDGRLVPPGDATALARAVLDLLNAPEERNRLATAARARVTDRFSIGRMVRRLEEIYTDVAEDRRRG